MSPHFRRHNETTKLDHNSMLWRGEESRLGDYHGWTEHWPPDGTPRTPEPRALLAWELHR